MINDISMYNIDYDRLCIFAYTLTLGSVPRYVSPSTPEPSTLGKSHIVFQCHIVTFARGICRISSRSML